MKWFLAEPLKRLVSQACAWFAYWNKSRPALSSADKVINSASNVEGVAEDSLNFLMK